MTELELHRIAAWTEIGLGVATFVLLGRVVAPYGRHARGGFGPRIGQRLSWILMELPAQAVWLGIYLLGRHAADAAPLVLMALWQTHYVYRTWIYPFRLRAAGKTNPLSIALTGMAFNVLNAYVNARWVSELGSYPDAWLRTPLFLTGALVFAAGLVTNHLADATLLSLRKPAETGYVIPRGPLFRFVSCPNYLGELVEWTGWAIATGSLAGLAFALYAASNLVPRALAHHRWYRDNFPDYPPDRRALVPFVL